MGRVCEIKGCEAKHYARGKCKSHYLSWYRRHGNSRRCEIEGCDRPHCAKGLCSSHYKRYSTNPDAGTHLIGEGPRPTVDPVIRFWSKVDKQGPIPVERPELGPCWQWLGTLRSGPNGGHGIFDVRSTKVSAHRFAYRLLVGEVPAGLELDHLCRNRGCVNPAHLEPVTTVENVRRGAVPKLTPDEVRAIRVAPDTYREIAARFGTSVPNVYMIRSRKTWVDVV